MPAVLPTAAKITSATQTNAQQKVDLASTLDYLAERLGSFTTTGTATAFVGTPVPAVTSYFAGLSFLVTLHVASGASPTLQISGLAVPPNIVRRLQNGAYQNVSALPAGPYRITLVSATQALAESLGPLITGTVSQSAGVPTGSIIERGSNANGEYVRFADGTQICTRNANLVGDTNAFQPFSTAAAFVALPSVSVSYATASSAGLSTDWFTLAAASSVHSETVSSIAMLYRGASLAVNGLVYIAAKGRWF